MSEQATAAPAPRSAAGTGRKIWRAVAIIAVIAILALLVYGLLSKGTSDRIDRALGNGRAVAAPSFNLTVLDRGQLPPRLAAKLGPALASGKLSTADLRGTPYVFNLWASWCTPCRGEAKPLQRAWEVAGRRGVAFIGLDVQDLSEDGRAFLDEFGITYPSLRDPERAVSKQWGATGIPETFFVDRDGDVVGHVIGAIGPKQIVAGVVAAQRGEVVGTADGGEQKNK